MKTRASLKYFVHGCRYKAIKNTKKLLTPKQVSQRLPITLKRAKSR